GRHGREVQANAGPGGRDGGPARIAFAVRPAWWRTWWFNMAAIAAVALLSHQLWAWRLRAILRRQKELEDAVADRTRNLRLEKVRAEAQKLEIERLFRESPQADRRKGQVLVNIRSGTPAPVERV